MRIILLDHQIQGFNFATSLDGLIVKDHSINGGALDFIKLTRMDHGMQEYFLKHGTWIISKPFLYCALIYYI